MKNMKKALIMAIGSAALMGAASAQAQVSPANVPNQFDYAGPNVSTVAFVGTTTLVKGIPLTCELKLIGDLVTSALPNVSIVVKDGSVTGSALCLAVNLNLDPSDSTTWWTATKDETALPNDADALNPITNITFTNLNISTPLGPCSGTISPVSFRNGDTDVSDPSVFSFSNAAISSGGCTVTGDLASQPNGDANIW